MKNVIKHLQTRIDNITKSLANYDEELKHLEEQKTIIMTRYIDTVETRKELQAAIEKLNA